MERARDAHHAFRDQVRTNALAEGLQPVVFVMTGNGIAPLVLVAEASPQEIYDATDQLAREMRAEAAVLAIELMARRTDTVAAFRELVEEGGLRPPSESGERTSAILWHRFADGRCETELDVYEGGTWTSQGVTSRPSPVAYFGTDEP